MYPWYKKAKLKDKGFTVVIRPPLEHASRRARILLYTGAFLILSVSAWALIRPARANVLRFYPSSCLGNWEGVSRALGAPDLEIGASPTAFTTENSALYTGGDRKMYCGTFNIQQTTDKVMRTVTLRLSMTAVDLSSSSAIPAPINTASSSSSTSSTNQMEPAASSSTSDSSSTPPQETPSKQITSSSSPESTQETEPASLPLNTNPTQNAQPELKDLVEPSQPSTETTQPATNPTPTETQGAPAPNPLPAPAPTNSTPPTSFLFIHRAFAQEINPTSPTPTSTILATSSILSSSTENSSGTDAVMGISFDLQHPGSAYTLPVDGELVQLFYSIDGEHWTALPSVTRSNVNSYEAILPLNNWDDIKNLQLNFQGVMSDQDQTRVFMDGISVEAEYDEATDNAPHPVKPKSTTPARKTYDPESRHTCAIEPFSKEVRPGENTYVTALLYPSAPGLQPSLEIGTLPEGVTGRLEPAPISSSTPSSTIPFLMHFTISPNTSSGSFNSILLYTETQTSSQKLTNFCQFNLEIR